MGTTPPVHRTDPAEPLASVRAALVEACARAGRDAGSVTLIAVSKTVPVDKVEHAVRCGQTVFGENRVQEAEAKWPLLRSRHHGLELHLVGSLQSNKVPAAVALFDAIHSLDRPRLALSIARECARQGRRPRLFIQVNTGAEPQKSGVLPQVTDAFIDACRDVHDLDIEGLMCIPPLDEPPAGHFALLADIAVRNGLRSLSMGMSADFVEAIAHGATHVRVGRGIFGDRP